MATISLIVQTLFGFLWGIAFIKSRNLLPGIISHYLVDFMPGIFVLIL